MARTYAFVNDNEVTSVVSLDDADVQSASSTNQLVIDIHDQSPQPAVGWILSGNQLILPNNEMTDDEFDSYQQKSQREYGMLLLTDIIDKLGQRNLKLGREGASFSVTTLASNSASIKLLLETGALKTARTVCEMVKPSFPLHEDIFDLAIARIDNFLSLNGFE